jgi:hypothetical protein
LIKAFTRTSGARAGAALTLVTVAMIAQTARLEAVAGVAALAAWGLPPALRGARETLRRRRREFRYRFSHRHQAARAARMAARRA